MTEGIEPVGVGARGDDLAVEFRRSVEIVVVVVEAGGFQPRRLIGTEHTQRGAGLQAQRLDAFDHGADGFEIALLRRTPRGAHAEARSAAGLGRTRLGKHRLDRHQLLGLDAGVVLRRLRTIGAVLRAAAGLDRQQCRDLHLGRVEMRAVRLRRAEHQFGERKREQRPHLGAGPVMTQILRRQILAGRAGGLARQMVVSKRHSLVPFAWAGTPISAGRPPRQHL